MSSSLLSPVERIKMMEETIEAQRAALTKLEIERDALRQIVEGGYEEPPTLTLRERSMWYDPVGKHRPQQPLERIGEIVKRLDIRIKDEQAKTGARAL